MKVLVRAVRSAGVVASRADHQDLGRRERCREHGVAIVLKIYAHCIDGQADAANNRITDALSTAEAEPGPGEEGDDDSEQAS
jgi:hypothetical protein